MLDQRDGLLYGLLRHALGQPVAAAVHKVLEVGAGADLAVAELLVGGFLE